MASTEPQFALIEIAARLLLRGHVDAWHALSRARLHGPEQALLRVYTFQDFSQWPAVLPAIVVAMGPCRFATVAAVDAMSRILWGRAKVAKAARAHELGVRVSEFRTATNQAEDVLRGWLLGAAVAYLVALAGRDRFTPGDRQTESTDLAV